MSASQPTGKELEDARKLFEFVKCHRIYAGDKDDLVVIAMRVAIRISGADYAKVAEDSGWTREELAKYEWGLLKGMS